MKRRILTLITLVLLFCLGAVGCNKKPVQNEPEKDIYTGTVLLNGFDTTADMYKVRQHTYVRDDRWTGYSALGKLQIVGKDDFIPVERDYQNAEVHKEEDMAPRQGEGALYVNYVSEIAEVGGFTQLIARFANSDLKDIPVDRLGGISVQIYNDNSTGRAVTLSLVKSDLSIVAFGENSVTLAPYAWTECKIDLNPAIVEYFQEDIIGLSVEFDSKNDSVYYLDNLCLSFEQVSSEEIAEYIKLVKALEADIDAKVVGKTVTTDLKADLTDLFTRYLALPKEYQAIVGNYTELDTAIKKYMSLVSDEELKNTGEVSLLRFDEIFGLTQITGSMGCKYSYTTEEHAPGEEGSLCVEFDGTVDWADLFVSPTVANYDEVRVWVKNDSEFARIIQLNWKTLATTGGTAYDENGTEITNALTDVDYNNNILAKGGWIQLVFRDYIDLPNFNLSSYDTAKRQVVKSQGKLYIGKVLGTSEAAGLMKRIDAIEEKDSYTDKELLEIFDVYFAVSKLSKELKNVLGLERVEKIENLYKANAAKILNAKIKVMEDKSEYSAAEITEIIGIQALCEELSKAEKQNVNIAKLNRIFQKVADYNKNGTNMDITAYDAAYGENLYYSTKETYSGAKFSVKYQTEIKDGNFVSITLPETITNAKRLKIAVKSTSDKTIAFWPKVSDTQGGLWLGPNNHEVTLTSDEGWVELIYDIEGMTIDSLLATYGPWENGNLQFYIGKIEVVTDMSQEVKSQIAKLSELLNQDEFTAAQMKEVQEIKAMYDGLSSADKKKVNAEILNAVLNKLSNYDKSGKNMNVLAYDAQYGNVLSYSLKEVLSGEKFSMKIASKITDKGTANVTIPETITGRKLTITVKNTSDKDIAFWPKGTNAQGDVWLNPTNHDGQPVIKAGEGWVELTYDIVGLPIDTWITTYGPWENGNFELYIGKIEVTKSAFAEVKKELENISALQDKDEFTATEIVQILGVKALYDNSLTAAEKKELDVTALNGVLAKIEHHDTAGTNMDVTNYDSNYQNTLLYSVKEKIDGADFSIKFDKEVGTEQEYLKLPEEIYGGKRLTITVKNTSGADIAFWPKLVEDQGSTWLAPSNHNSSPIITADEGWVELTYDIADMTIDMLVATYGPWQSGQLGFYIGEIKVETTYLSVVQAELESIEAFLDKDEFTAAEISQILRVKEIYDSKLTEEEKQTFSAEKFLAAVEKIQYYSTAGTNMDVTKYDSSYGDIVSYSVKEKLEGENFSLKVNQEIGPEIATAGTNINLPEVISGAKKLTITVKNTSDKDIAIWPYSSTQGGAWLNPTNHDVILTKDEGWVELEYNIDGQDIDTLIMTYGPWASGQLEFYIGKIEVVTTYYPVVEEAFNNVAGIFNQEEFTAAQIEQIMNVKTMYDTMLTEVEQQALEAESLLAAVEKIQYYNTAGTNMDVTKYDSSYGDIVSYSVKEKVEGENFSLKVNQEIGPEIATAGTSINLPEVISGAKTLTITVKNTSDKNIAIWPYATAQGGDWLVPTNHNNQPVITVAEGWTELTYNISGLDIDTLIMTYGPWESGQIEFYIGGIEVSNQAVVTLSQVSITSLTGSTYSTTEEGYVKVDFDGSAAWCDVNFAAITAGSKIHMFIKNDSDSRRIVAMNWTGAVQVLNENGEDVTASIVDGTTTILPENSGWLEVIYPITSGIQLNCCSLVGETGGEPQNSVGSLYIKGYSVE